MISLLAALALQGCPVAIDLNLTPVGVSSVGSSSAARDGAFLNGEFHFSGYSLDGGSELWALDPVANAVRRVADIRPGIEGSVPRAFVVHQGALWFHADDGVHGRELWRSYGTTLGTTLVADLNIGLGDGVVGDLFAFAGFVYFGGTTAASGTELWASNGL